MTPQQIQSEREKFEAPFPTLMLEKEGEDHAYVNTAVYAQWKGWLARATACESESKLEAACAEKQRLVEFVFTMPDSDDLSHWLEPLVNLAREVNAPNPGAHLLTQLQAADELAKASAHILRACASSVPHVFSNAQFALGEKLEAYKTAKEAR